MLDFLICYEHVNREVENIALVKYELEKRGYSCKIIPFNGPGFFTHTMLKKAKVVVTPWLRYDENVFHFLCMARKPYRLVNLQWEQVYSIADIQSGMVGIYGNAKEASHICWGANSQRRLLMEGVNSDRLPITGAIQLDYGFPVFEKYYLSKREISSIYNLDNSKRWILIVSSFAYVNYGDDAIRELEIQFNCSLQDQVKLHVDSQSQLLDWVEEFIQQSECELIYRPHPSERTNSRLKSLEENYGCFHIISDYSVKQWAQVCDRVNLWISTSNAEIASLGISYAIVRPVPIPVELEVESMMEEDSISSFDDFVKFNSLIETKFERPQMERLANFYSYDTNYPAYVNVVDYLERVIINPIEAEYKFTLIQKTEYSWRELKKGIVSLIGEICCQKNRLRLIDNLPLKSVIKANIKNSIKKYNQGKIVENKMIQYMENSEGFHE